MAANHQLRRQHLAITAFDFKVNVWSRATGVWDWLDGAESIFSGTGSCELAEALEILRSKKIDEVPVVDADRRPVGLLDVQDLLKAGIW